MVAIGIPKEFLSGGSAVDLTTALRLPMIEPQRGGPEVWLDSDADLFAFLGARSVSDVAQAFRSYGWSSGLDSDLADELCVSVSPEHLTVTVAGRSWREEFPMDLTDILDVFTGWGPSTARRE